ncbi:hypothetical protein ACE1ET_20615, partial [Saccharicrinis sp. FJH62]|uniref:hypothetical protein n=1 Tax=Saccharicrinis sp. FJH62 TaxID=3344657 RepID=UPI0035D52829
LLANLQASYLLPSLNTLFGRAQGGYLDNCLLLGFIGLTIEHGPYYKWIKFIYYAGNITRCQCFVDILVYNH